MFSEGFTGTTINFSNLQNITQVFQDQVAQYNDLASTGDKFFGTSAPSTIIADVVGRNKDLSGQLTDLHNKIAQLRLTTEQNDRDFIDTRDALPDVLPSRSMVHVLDSYTLFLVVITYMILALSCVFYYAQRNNYTLTSILIGAGGGALVSLILFVVGIIVL